MLTILALMKCLVKDFFQYHAMSLVAALSRSGYGEKNTGRHVVSHWTIAFMCLVWF